MEVLLVVVFLLLVTSENINGRVDALSLNYYPGLKKNTFVRNGKGPDLTLSGRVLCASYPDKSPASIEIWQEGGSEFPPERKNTSNLESGNLNIAVKTYGKDMGRRSDKLYMVIPTEILFKCINSASIDSTLAEFRYFTKGMSLRIPDIIPDVGHHDDNFDTYQFTTEDLFIVVDLGVFDYKEWMEKKATVGTHKKPILAIGGKVLCSIGDKKDTAEYITVALRIGKRIISEAMANKEGQFYMQTYDERYDTMYTVNKSTNMNIFIEHECKTGSGTGTAQIPVYVDFEKAKNSREATTFKQALLYVADYAICPTVWIENIDLKNF